MICAAFAQIGCAAFLGDQRDGVFHALLGGVGAMTVSAYLFPYMAELGASESFMGWSLLIATIKATEFAYWDLLRALKEDEGAPAPTTGPVQASPAARGQSPAPKPRRHL